MIALGVLYIFDGFNQEFPGNGLTGLAVSEPARDVSCEDTDSRDYYAAGTTYARLFTVNGEEPKSDVCEGDTLIEYYCVYDEPQVEFYECPNGCISGTCAQ